MTNLDIILLLCFICYFIGSITMYFITFPIIKNKNNVHFYVVCSNTGEKELYLGKPIRNEKARCWISKDPTGCFICLEPTFRQYGLNPDEYKHLTFYSDPIEVFLNKVFI